MKNKVSIWVNWKPFFYLVNCVPEFERYVGGGDVDCCAAATAAAIRRPCDCLSRSKRSSLKISVMKIMKALTLLNILPQSIFLHRRLVWRRGWTVLKFRIKQTMRHAAISQALLATTMLKLCAFNPQTVRTISCCYFPRNTAYRHEHQANACNKTAEFPLWNMNEFSGKKIVKLFILFKCKNIIGWWTLLVFKLTNHQKRNS